VSRKKSVLHEPSPLRAIDDDDEVWTPLQTASYLNVHVGTLANWRANKRYPELKSFKLAGRAGIKGGRVAYLKSSVKEFVAVRSRGGVA
jgi:hypothetical protein